MENNPILEEIRRVRLAIEAECKNDPQLLYEYFCHVQDKYRDRLVSRRPKPAIMPSNSIENLVVKPN